MNTEDTELKEESTGPDSILVPADFKATTEMMIKVLQRMLKLDKSGQAINKHKLFRNLGKVERVWVKGTYDRMLKLKMIEPVDTGQVKGRRARVVIKFTDEAFDFLDTMGVRYKIDHENATSYPLMWIAQVDRELLSDFEWACRNHKHPENPARALENQIRIAMMMVKEYDVPLSKPQEAQAGITPAPLIQEPAAKVEPVATATASSEGPSVEDDDMIAF